MRSSTLVQPAAIRSNSRAICWRAATTAVVPGITFGPSCDRYVRIAFTIADDELREGLAAAARSYRHAQPQIVTRSTGG